MNPKSISAAYQKVNSGAGSRYVQPAIRTKISNISANGDAYWVGALYLSSRFGISHRYADVQRLSEDESNTFLELKYKDPNGKSYEGIPLELEEGYHRLGISEITDYIVIFVSNRSFDLAQYYQDPLPLTTVRGAGFGAAADDGAVEKDFWFTIKIPVHIRYPIDQKRLPADGKINLGALTVEGAPGFTALIQPTTRAAARNRLRNQEEKTRAPLPEKAFIPPGHLWMHTETSEAIFSRGMSGARPDDYVNLLELTGVQGEVTEDRPLTIIPHTPLLPSESIVAFAYDPEDDLYYPVGYTDASGRIKIIRLPSYTPGIIGGLGDEELTADTERDVKGSMKLFFHKVVWSRLSGRKDYNTLTLFARKAGGSLERWEYKEGPVESYLQSREKIRQQLGAGSGDVLLLVHGWVGDGESMAEAIFHKTELYRLFDAVLNFAYENLNTPIDDIARKLMEMLRACGLENRRLVVLSHSMGGLVSRSFIEHAGGEKFVKRLIQVGSPNGGAVIADTRKRLFNSLVRSMNGAGELEPYSTLASFIFKGVDGRPFVTADEMQTKSEFIRRLNAPDKQPPRAPYDLIAGHLKEEEPETEKQKSRLGKAWDDLRRRGKYELFDLAFFREAPNDWIVRVDSMKTVPWGHTRVEYIYCDHFSYFKTEEGLAALVRMFS
jgi:pimeloyl-ACP methyl ester carboxylesterase